MRIEWPKGSGRYADYSDDELEVIRRMIRRCDAGEIPKSEVNSQVNVFHDLKVEFGADISKLEEDPEQLELLPDPGANEIGAYTRHSNAPETHRNAALAMFPGLGSKRRKVLDFVASRGDFGATDDEIYAGTRLPPNTARPRRWELVNYGWLIDSGKRRKAVSGELVAVWVLSDKANNQMPKQPRQPFTL